MDGYISLFDRFMGDPMHFEECIWKNHVGEGCSKESRVYGSISLMAIPSGCMGVCLEQGLMEAAKHMLWLVCRRDRMRLRACVKRWLTSMEDSTGMELGKASTIPVSGPRPDATSNLNTHPAINNYPNNAFMRLTPPPCKCFMSSRSGHQSRLPYNTSTHRFRKMLKGYVDGVPDRLGVRFPNRPLLFARLDYDKHVGRFIFL